MTTITLKASFQNVTRRFQIPGDVTFPALESTLKSRFSATDPFVITYLDSDQDIITVSSDEELAELISPPTQTTSTIRVFLFTSEEIVAGATAPRSVPTPQPTSVHIPHLDALVGNVSELLSTIKENIPPAFAFPHKPGSPADRQNARGEGHGRKVRRGGFAAFRPYIAAFPNGKAGFRKIARSVSPQVKMEFKKLVHYVISSDNRASIVASLKEAFPVLREWIANELVDGGVPSAEKVENLICAVEGILTTKTSEETTKKITDFMRLAMADEGVVNMLRGVTEMGLMPWEDGFVLSIRGNKRRGFDVHQGIRCSGCDIRPIVGTRYMCVNRANFNLCAECYEKGDNNREGFTFRECKYVWDSIIGTEIVPPPTLKLKDRGPKVKFLHKVLTDLGYMNEVIYHNRPGLYSDSTKAAVVQFQRENSIDTTAECGTYDAITSAALDNVVRSRNHATPSGTEPEHMQD